MMRWPALRRSPFLTPGSPISTGLFFAARQDLHHAPTVAAMTGSSLPLRNLGEVAREAAATDTCFPVLIGTRAADAFERRSS
jgi:hypothetical protein